MPLTRTRSVLHHHTTVNNTATFCHEDRDRHLTMAAFDWDDMGRPDTITVSIEPGDHLNVED